MDVATNISAPSGGRYRKPLRKMRWSDIRQLLEESAAGWSKHKTPRLGAALAFYALLSFMPLLLLAISIAGLVFGPRAAQSGVLQQVQILIGEQRATIVRGLLEGAQSKANGLAATVLEIATLMFGASGVLMELRDSLNTIWNLPPRQLTTFQEIASMVKERLWSFLVVLAIVFLLTASLLVSTWISAVGSLYASVMPSHEFVLHVMNATLSFIVVTGLFGAIYKLVPEVPLEWRDVTLGAAATSIFFTLGNLLLGLYLGKASFSSTYGAAASMVLLSIWVYYSCQIFLLGAEFTRAFAEICGSDPGKNPRPVIAASDAEATTPTGESAPRRIQV